MDINLDDLYFPTEEEIKESISLTSNEESEEPYYLPTICIANNKIFITAIFICIFCRC